MCVCVSKNRGSNESQKNDFQGRQTRIPRSTKSPVCHQVWGVKNRAGQHLCPSSNSSFFVVSPFLVLSTALLAVLLHVATFPILFCNIVTYCNCISRSRVNVAGRKLQ